MTAFSVSFTRGSEDVLYSWITFEFCNAKNGDNLVSFSEVDLLSKRVRIFWILFGSKINILAQVIIFKNFLIIKVRVGLILFG